MRGADGVADPTGGMDLLVRHLESLPLDAFAVPTAAMVVEVVGIEVGFVVVQR